VCLWTRHACHLLAFYFSSRFLSPFHVPGRATPVIPASSPRFFVFFRWLPLFHVVPRSTGLILWSQGPGCFLVLVRVLLFYPPLSPQDFRNLSLLPVVGLLRSMTAYSFAFFLSPNRGFRALSFLIDCAKEVMALESSAFNSLSIFFFFLCPSSFLSTFSFFSPSDQIRSNFLARSAPQCLNLPAVPFHSFLPFPGVLFVNLTGAENAPPLKGAQAWIHAFKVFPPLLF